MKAELRFAVDQDGVGRKVTAYQREHGKELHLILASRDLAVYRHLHPVRAADGTWSTSVDLPRTGGYRVFADFKPKDGEALTLGADLAVSGKCEPAELPTHNTTATVDGYEVKLDGDLPPGKASELTLTVTKGDKPVRDLQPSLGAYGHLVALRSAVTSPTCTSIPTASPATARPSRAPRSPSRPRHPASVRTACSWTSSTRGRSAPQPSRCTRAVRRMSRTSPRAPSPPRERPGTHTEARGPHGAPVRAAPRRCL
ncbi:putative Heavy metal-associated domain protein [Streptomyces viridochromogenes Tue57]|uniref:Putative Heavy metal-associated domain protein n=1 Tax=Streptomyces viridochromogenes Tue57 TaxID=1160705 RepID=L8PR82_STRVR|nr:putative Heavy metal-associated domain protein [Streptomyces viridochromogenes Tue57]